MNILLANVVYETEDFFKDFSKENINKEMQPSTLVWKCHSTHLLESLFHNLMLFSYHSRLL